MFTIGQLDEHVTHDQQTEDDTEGPVVLVNIFHVKPEEGDDLTAVWGDIIRQFKTSPATSLPSSTAAPPAAAPS